ncbi:hypothetical protein PYW07_005550 [Mythimna separata]|uniref:Uncharacterized protein n=1 Tax=Mythimna separata TaxID=271217 RepID=A0AAD7YJP6_MYTSE|nr:hypothetical protein PYW07_005550 [Mythimna separata]
MLTVLDGVAHVIQLEYRLKRIKDILQHLVYCVNLLLNMINLLNLAIRFYTGLMVTPNGVCRLPSISSLLRMLNWVMVALIEVYRCESTYRESEEIVENIDLLLINKNISANLTKTLIEFRNLLITRPIKFHAIRFFNIEYPLLASVASVVVTYTIILLQSIK